MDVRPHHHYLSWVAAVLELYALVVLLARHADFRRPMRRQSLRNALIWGVAGLLVIFINAVVGRMIMRSQLGHPVSPRAAASRTLRLLIGLDTPTGLSQPAAGYAWATLCLVWVCAAAVIVLVTRAAIVGRVTTRAERDRARALVLEHGHNPSAYLTLEADKTLFFGAGVPGVIAYGVVGSVIVVNGDPICADGDIVRLLAEFKAFCDAGSYECVFLATTAAYLDRYALLGFHHTKCGEDARFDLDDYNLVGGRRAKLRAMVNHARVAGLTVAEYKPLTDHDAATEREIRHVSDAWPRMKKSGRLGFCLGGVDLDDPMDRRYFCARDADGRVVAFSVFLPYADGYLVDVTRRLPDAAAGATELITHEAFLAFQAEGVAHASLGLATLADVTSEGDEIEARLLAQIFERGNSFFGFKSLLVAKRKYSPTRWEPAYFVYSSRHLTPAMAYAIVRIQNPNGMLDYFRGAWAVRTPKQAVDKR
jgi:phosphatidylglycerol lysyltransferase